MACEFVLASLRHHSHGEWRSARHEWSRNMSGTAGTARRSTPPSRSPCEETWSVCGLPCSCPSTKSSHLAAQLLLAIVLLAPRCHARLPGDCSVPVGGTVPVRVSRLRPCMRPCVFSFYRATAGTDLLYTGSPPNCRHAKNTRQPKGRLPGCTQGCPESGYCPS